MHGKNRCVVLLFLVTILFSSFSAARAVEVSSFYYDSEYRYAATEQQTAALRIRSDFYSTLSMASRAVYDSLVDNLTSLRDGKAEISFFFPESVSYDEISATMYQDAMNAFNRDHSEAFWLDMAAMKLTVTQTGDGRLQGTITPVDGTYYTSAYTSITEVERDVALMEERIEEIVSASAALDTIYERLLYIHDWLVLHSACNADGISSHMRAFEAVSALEGNMTGDSRPVCEGYARAFKLLCDELGIPCMLITGEGVSGNVTESHMWNYVQLDGAWYAVDVTWDDPLYLEERGEPRYTYFLVGSGTRCDEGMTFLQNHREVKKLSTHASDITYPVLAESAYVPQEEAATGSMENFSHARVYQNGIFSDVERGAWYEDGIASAYSLGLMSGTGDGKFNVTGMVTIAEALTMASRIHAAYYGNEDELQPVGEWYETYVEYAFAHNIIRRQYPDYHAAATRAEFAVIFAAVLPETAFASLSDIADGSVPDIPSTAAYADAAYLLYRAGVLIGDESGLFQPDTYISRAEVALIVTRVVDVRSRVAQ